MIIIIQNLKMQRDDPACICFEYKQHSYFFLLFKEMQEWHLYAIVISSPLRSTIFVLSNVMQFFET